MSMKCHLLLLEDIEILQCKKLHWIWIKKANDKGKKDKLENGREPI